MAKDTEKLPLDEATLEKIAGGLSSILPACTTHDWVFTGSYTDAGRNVTKNYYKCSKCGAEKTESI